MPAIRRHPGSNPVNCIAVGLDKGNESFTFIYVTLTFLITYYVNLEANINNSVIVSRSVLFFFFLYT